MKTNKMLIRFLAGAAAIILFVGLMPQAKVNALQGLPQGAQEERVTDPATGRLIFLKFEGESAPGEVSATGLTPEQSALAYVQQYALAFGLSDPAHELALESIRPLSGGRFVARYQQMYAGVPVFGGVLQVRIAANGKLESISGNVQPNLSLAVTPAISPESAVESAIQHTALTRKIPAGDLTPTETSLQVYVPRLVDDGNPSSPGLVWQVKLDAGRPYLLVVLVDAQTGIARLNFEQRRPPAAASAQLAAPPQNESVQALAGQAQWNLYTSAFEFTMYPRDDVLDNDGVTSRSNLLCNQDTTEHCGDLNASRTDALRTYPAIESAYNFFYNKLGRDGWNGNGDPWNAYVNYGRARSSTEWRLVVMHGDGSQAGFADTVVSHDIVAREYAYDVVQYDTGLYGLYQSGAIAESLADMWGEFIDQSFKLDLVDAAKGPDNDAATVRWLIGEDIFPGATVQYLRNMKTPTLKQQPDSMTSPYYYKGPMEQGLPMVNSGVNNKAVVLMVDGGTFNRLTIGKVGMEKTAAIYYKAQREYLFPSADYYDLYLALKASCNDLIDTQPIGATTPISTTDCLNVEKALRAVKMDTKPATLSSVPVPACPLRTEKGVTLFSDDFNSGDLSQWVFAANKYRVSQNETTKVLTIDEIVPINDQTSWTTLANALAENVSKALYAPGISALDELDNDGHHVDFADEMAMPANAITLPAGSQVYLTFDHMFLFESTYLTNLPHDGGVLEYSKDGGVTWLDAKPLYNLGLNYNGIVGAERSPFFFNPLMGQLAFVNNSLGGRVTTRYNLSTLAGQTILLRWRIGYDDVTGWGWAIDNVSIHTCVGVPSIPVLLTPANGALIYDNPEDVYRPRLDWRDSTPDLHHYQIQVARDSKFTDLVYDTTVTDSEFTPPNTLDPNTKYYWRVKAFNVNNGAYNWSQVRYFLTAMLRPRNLNLPADGAETKTRRPNFAWDDPNTIGPAALTYTLQIGRDANFTSLVGTYTTLNNTTSFTPTVDLPANSLFYWRVKANGANPSQYSSEVKSFHTGNPPSVPVLTAPTNNALVQPIPNPLTNPSAWQYTPYLDWNIVTVPAGVTFNRYEVQLSDAADFSNLIVDEDITDINHHYYQVPISLNPNTTYYWRVQSVANDEDFSNWATRSFRTALLPPQTLINPADEQPAHTRRPTFEWDAVSGATGYTIQLSTVPTFATVNYTYMVKNPVTSYTHTADVAANTTYYWRICSNGLNGPSLYSAPHKFTSGNPPTVPSLVAPAQNALLTVYTPMLDWGASVAPLGTTFDHYEVQWADNADFTGAESRDVPGLLNHAYTIQAGEALNPNKVYYWRVRSWNTDGDFSGWSPVRSFRTAMLPPTLVYPIAGNNTVNTLQPTLDWGDVDGAVTYTVQISLYSTMSKPFLSVNTVAGAPSEYTVPAGKLQYGKTYYWWVRANGPNGPSLWSAIETFQPSP
ncbi:MAG: glycoside hydrolase family 78 protein [Candidatus Villigracilaceae bacterium]